MKYKILNNVLVAIFRIICIVKIIANIVNCISIIIIVSYINSCRQIMSLCFNLFVLCYFFISEYFSKIKKIDSLREYEPLIWVAGFIGNTFASVITSLISNWSDYSLIQLVVLIVPLIAHLIPAITASIYKYQNKEKPYKICLFIKQWVVLILCVLGVSPIIYFRANVLDFIPPIIIGFDSYKTITSDGNNENAENAEDEKCAVSNSNLIE